jgi:hypothetical protein
MRTILLACVLALPLAACGGRTTTGSTNAASGPAQSPVAAAFAYSRCMRQHGVPNFPDPQVHMSGGKGSIAIGINPGISGTPAFNGAQHACRGILPGPKDLSPAEQHARALNLLAFARCMRTRGVSNFPDPTSTGQITQEMLAAAHVDVRVVSVQRAAYACVPSAGGAVRPAQIQAAIAHGG